MRRTARYLLPLVIAGIGQAHGQALVMPANADMRAMSAPIDWEGSRAQRTQDADGVPIPASPLSRITSAVPFIGSAASSSDETVASAAPPRAAAPTGTSPQDYTIVALNDQGQVTETIAHVSSLAVARAAFKEAAKERSRMLVELRQGTTTVAKHAAQAIASR